MPHYLYPMVQVRTFLLSRRYWAGFLLIAVIKCIILWLTCPLYDLDTNSFIRGGFTWDIYHNPWMNLFIASLGKLWANAWFIVGVQVVCFAGLATYFLEAWFAKLLGQRKWLAPSLWLLVALEPVTGFYNQSLLAESFFIGFTLLSMGAAAQWLRDPKPKFALLMGAGMGLTFLCKLSALIHLPLFGIFLLRKPFFKIGFRQIWLALTPFALAYGFVFFGQKIINEGDLYTVEGRVRWDFSSSQYRPEEVNAPLFKRYVHPYLFQNGALLPHRELRREMSYLGYKDCVTDMERQGLSHSRGINRCDSIFGAVAAQILTRHFWPSEQQFVADNFRFIHELNYLELRYTKGLHYYYPDHEWQYLDSLMGQHYQFDLSQNAAKIPVIWTSKSFANGYLTVVWWGWWAVVLLLVAGGWRGKLPTEAWVAGLFLAVPLLFHFVYISYRTRFLAPYLILMICMGLYLILQWPPIKSIISSEK